MALEEAHAILGGVWAVFSPVGSAGQVLRGAVGHHPPENGSVVRVLLSRLFH